MDGQIDRHGKTQVACPLIIFKTCLPGVWSQDPLLYLPSGYFYQNQSEITKTVINPEPYFKVAKQLLTHNQSKMAKTKNKLW